MKKEYQALLDITDLKGRFWFSGGTRKLTKEEAKPYLIKNKIALSDKELLENMLHPTTVIEGVNIEHRHVGRRIIFEGWKNNKRSSRSISYDRQYLLCTLTSNKDFYDENYSILKELCEN